MACGRVGATECDRRPIEPGEIHTASTPRMTKTISAKAPSTLRTRTKTTPAFEPNKLTKKRYEAELERLQKELVKLQEWVRVKGLRVVVLFEGRDAAGKGGVINRIASCTNPRVCRV